MSQGGFGLTLSIDGAAIVGVREADIPNMKKFIAEATAHDSPSGYYAAVATGKRQLESVNVVLIWDSAQTTHAAVLTAFASDAANTFVVADPDGDESISFSAHVETVGRVARQEETYVCNVTLHPTGPATIT